MAEVKTYYRNSINLLSQDTGIALRFWVMRENIILSKQKWTQIGADRQRHATRRTVDIAVSAIEQVNNYSSFVFVKRFEGLLRKTPRNYN